jgi:hypothetical protein
MFEKRLFTGFFLIVSLIFLNTTVTSAQKQHRLNQFRQLYQELPTPNESRTASGAPGPKYWQQRTDYDISVDLDENKQRIYGEETITYFNNSPESLPYLWLQLDQNIRAEESMTKKTVTGRISDTMSFSYLKRMHSDFDGGFKIEYVKDTKGRDLHCKVVNTMMRVDLPNALKPHSKYSFKIKWWYNINDESKIGGRSGFEYYEKDGNHVFAIAQFFPRMAVYNETEGWQHKQFLGSGEFALPFGNYRVRITVPSDHIVGATGILQNRSKVLTAHQMEQLSKAQKKTDDTVIIVSEDEAVENEKSRADTKKTWLFKAENVRDFAFASSRKFIWDAMAVKFGERTSLAMSYYTKEGNPLWEKYSTRAVAHAMKVYSKYTFDYPYPKAISVLTGGGGGMEYPMVSFNGGKPEPDGTYSERLKYSLIGVIIHEVGHNFFPMIVNSDERQWAWMDEGLNTFMEYLSEQEWEREFAERNGPAYTVINYMKGDKRQIYPIMTAPDSDLHVGSNAYAKTAAGLNILRETIMGRELFDFAFKEYARRWKFKHPTPADFFRTMEDASGLDLDWFWRGWFFSTDHVDLAVDNVKWYKINTQEPKLAKSIKYEKENRNRRRFISNIRNKKEIEKTALEKDKSLADFYDKHDPLEVIPSDEKEYDDYLKSLTEEEKVLLKAGHNYYEVALSNVSGMVMPVILKFEYSDGSEEVKRIPAEIWRKYNDHVEKIFVTKKEIRNITLDPFLETADVDTRNNTWTVQEKPDYFKVKKHKSPSGKNLMQQVKKKGG